MNARVIAKAEIDPEVRRRRQCVSMAAFLVAVMIASIAASAVGQDPYKRLPIKENLQNDRVIKTMRSALKSFAASSEGMQSSQAPAAMAYVKQYVPARITQADATPEISGLIDDVLDSIKVAQQRGNTAVANEIIKAFFGRMGQIAVGNYQPAARVAATLAIGRLNSRAADLRTQAPPVPFSGSYRPLVALYSSPKYPEGVRGAALHGLHRFVGLMFPKLPQGEKDKLAGLMQKLLTEPVPAGRTEEAHAYLQRYAVDILDWVRPDDTTVAQALVSISSDRNRPGLIALHSAATFGRSPVAGKAKIDDPLDTLDQWTARAYRAFKGEVDRLQAFNQPREVAKVQPELPQDLLAPAEEEVEVGGDGGYGDDDMEDGGYGDDDMDDGGGYGDDMEDGGYGMPMVIEEFEPQPAPVVATRRYLNHVLQQIHIGVTGSGKPGMPSQPGGLLLVADDAAKVKIRNWVTEVEEMLESLNDKSLEEQNDFVIALQELTTTLRNMAGEAAKDPPKAPVEAEGDLADTAPVGGEALVTR